MKKTIYLFIVVFVGILFLLIVSIEKNKSKDEYNQLIQKIDHTLSGREGDRMQSWSRNEDTIAAAIEASSDTIERQRLQLRRGIVSGAKNRLEVLIGQNPEPWVGGIASYVLMGLYSREGGHQKALELYNFANERGWLYAAYRSDDPEAQVIRTSIAMPDGMNEQGICARVATLPVPYYIFTNDTATAIEILTEVVDKYPQTEEAPKAKLYLSLLAENFCPFVDISRRRAN